jgi:hypothetical protein
LVEQRNSGAVEHWADGTMERLNMGQWNSGTVVKSGTGTMDLWASGTMALWNNGVVEQWGGGTVGRWNSGAVEQEQLSRRTIVQ